MTAVTLIAAATGGSGSYVVKVKRLGACLLGTIKAFDRRQRQLVHIGLAVHHTLDDDACEQVTQAVRRQCARLAVQRV
jgi:hypothetical protein